ncbi:carboxypeptidase-like regulatory domain-containing protein [Saccharibacillus sacchari]|uniref:carboxypeptidase-like regulatory domain-containing protein n=1 Tax=Saccharibacillus sacchari TaxID=456493 RepID=UPI0004B9A0E2|nr:carboxypeptidase-like regulatory domain-containing protein [Saccharibacillus sacchari]
MNQTKPSRKRLTLCIVFALIAATLLTVWLVSTFDRFQAFQTPEQKLLHAMEDIEQADGNSKAKLIEQTVIEPYAYTPYTFDVHLGASSMLRSGSTEDALLAPEERIPLLEWYMQNAEPNHYLIRAAEQLAYEYDVLGKNADADQALADAAARLSKNTAERRDLLLLQAERHLESGNTVQTRKLLEQAGPAKNDIVFNGLSETYGWLSSRLLFAEGQAKSALESAQQALAEQARIEKDGYTSESYIALEDYRSSLKTALKQHDSDPYVFSGKFVRGDGTPVTRAGIFLRESDRSQYRGDKEPYHAVTDDTGTFEIRGIVPGFYELEVGLSYEQLEDWSWPFNWDDRIEIKGNSTIERELTMTPLIDQQSPVGGQELTGDTVEFRWEKVDGAAYYELGGMIPNHDNSGGMGSMIRSGITDNHISLTLDELYGTSGGLTWSEDNDWESTQPNTLLAYMNPEAKFSWSVEAYDAEGNKIAQSSGPRIDSKSIEKRPEFYLKQRTLNPADRLVLKGELAQALDRYRSNVEADPNDTESLRLLTRLLYAKSQIGEDQTMQELIPLLERLSEHSTNPREIAKLLYLFYENTDWAKYEQYYRLYTESNPQPIDAYERSIHATVLLYQGKIDEARQEFSDALSDDGTHRFVGMALAAELTAHQPLTKVREMARSYPELSQENSWTYWSDLLEAMEKERSASPDTFDAQLDKTLTSFLNNRQADVKAKAPASSGLPSIDDFVEALAQVN